MSEHNALRRLTIVVGIIGSLSAVVGVAWEIWRDTNPDTGASPSPPQVKPGDDPVSPVQPQPHQPNPPEIYYPPLIVPEPEDPIQEKPAIPSSASLPEVGTEFPQFQPDQYRGAKEFASYAIGSTIGALVCYKLSDKNTLVTVGCSIVGGIIGVNIYQNYMDSSDRDYVKKLILRNVEMGSWENLRKNHIYQYQKLSTIEDCAVAKITMDIPNSRTQIESVHYTFCK